MPSVTPDTPILELTRTVRGCMSLTGDDWSIHPRHNTFSGWPSMAGLGMYIELDVTVRGRPDPKTGYLIGIQHLDAMVRDHAWPILARAIADERTVQPERLLHTLLHAMQSHAPCPLVAVAWQLTPFYRLTAEADHMNAVTYRQQFDFAAAHRLHSDELSDAENVDVFGKCNNRHGHGHNYRLEVDVSAEISDAADGFRLPVLERIVKAEVVDRFDHTNLNLDVDDFADVIPSVEHIARICYERLREPLDDAGGRLRQVTVWETEKTCCTYPAPS
ncbi:MAG: 6-carboxytetrahydropterin synthase [Planctomycetota bacterium]